MHLSAVLTQEITKRRKDSKHKTRKTEYCENSLKMALKRAFIFLALQLTFSFVVCFLDNNDIPVNELFTINGVLVRVTDNCTVHDPSTCQQGHCCVKKDLHYPAIYNGSRPAYQLQCDPLRKRGETCYFNTPPEFCPCENKCASNGFYGHCV